MPRTAFSFAATSLTAAALCIPFGVTQTNPPAKLQREVKFEILSFRPIKPGAGLSFNDHPMPDGYRATLSIWQAIMLAYTSDDSATWGATQIKEHAELALATSTTSMPACRKPASQPGNTKARSMNCSALPCVPRYETAVNSRSTKNLRKRKC